MALMQLKETLQAKQKNKCWSGAVIVTKRGDVCLCSRESRSLPCCKWRNLRHAVKPMN